MGWGELQADFEAHITDMMKSDDDMGQEAAEGLTMVYTDWRTL